MGPIRIRADRLADEVGTITSRRRCAIALVYPSPYTVGMSSLGFQTVYRMLNALPDVSAERAFLPDDVAPRARCARAAAHATNRPGPSVTSRWSRSRWPTSWSWPALVDCLDLAGIPAFAEERAGAPAGPR